MVESGLPVRAGQAVGPLVAAVGVVFPAVAVALEVEAAADRGKRPSTISANVPVSTDQTYFRNK